MEEKKFGRLAREAAQKAQQLGNSAAKATAETLHGLNSRIAANSDNISKTTADKIKHAGAKISGGASDVNQWLESHKDLSLATESPQILDRALKGAISAGQSLMRGVEKVERWTEEAAPVVGASFSGALSGLVNSASGSIDLIAISQEDFTALENRLDHARRKLDEDARYEALKIADARQTGRKQELLDLLVVGGVTLGTALKNPDEVPPEVERAFELAYPGLVGSGERFADAVERMSTGELTGLVSGVKGKLFELQLVDQLNAGTLPDGLEAVLASSPTQSGYDIQIVDENGRIMEELQAKATDSVAYVREALERNPNIDIITTSEVHGALLQAGFGDRVADSGISLSEVDGTLQKAVEANPGLDLIDLAPSSIGLAMIAYSAFSQEGLTKEERGIQFGQRSAGVTVSSAVGGLALLATNTWWLALVAGLGSQSVAATGAQKRERFEALKSVTERLEAEAERLGNR
jgi:hypothetical protein